MIVDDPTIPACTGHEIPGCTECAWYIHDRTPILDIIIFPIRLLFFVGVSGLYGLRSFFFRHAQRYHISEHVVIQRVSLRCHRQIYHRAYNISGVIQGPTLAAINKPRFGTRFQCMIRKIVIWTRMLLIKRNNIYIICTYIICIYIYMYTCIHIL